jgi:hypothetical protein
MSLDTINFGDFGKKQPEEKEEKIEAAPGLQINEIVRLPDQKEIININDVEGNLEKIKQEDVDDAERQRRINEIIKRPSLN